MATTGRQKVREALGFSRYRASRTLAIPVAMCCVLATGAALAGGGVAADDPGERRFCTATTLAQSDACRYETRDDFSIAKAKCINVSDGDERSACFGTAREARAEARQLEVPFG